MKLYTYKSRSMRGSKGIALLFTLAVMIPVISVVMAYLGYVHHSAKSTEAQISSSQAVYLAEAGIHYAIYNLKQDSSWTGTASAVDKGKGEFSVMVVSLGGGEFRLISTGVVNNVIRTIRQDVSDTFIPKVNTWQEGG